MDKQNSKDHKDPTCNTKATLQYAATLKSRIQNQVFEMTAALKKAEHELCMQIDRQCRSKLQGLEYFCEGDKCRAGCQNLNTQFDNDVGFPKKAKLERDFRLCLRLLQSYGQSGKYDFSKIMWRTSEAFKDIPVTDQSKENVDQEGDFEERFEFVDSVECLSEEFHSKLRNVLRNTDKNLPVTVDDSEEALERASCSSVDSFDVIPNECPMNNSISTNTQTLLPSIVPLPKLPETNSFKDRSHGPITFYLPTHNEREREEPKTYFSRIFKCSPSEFVIPEPTEFNKVYKSTSKGTASYAEEGARVRKEHNTSFSQVFKRSPSEKTPAVIPEPTEFNKVYISTSKGTASYAEQGAGLLFSFPGIAQEVNANASAANTTEVVKDAEVLPSTSEANAFAQQEINANASAATEAVDDVEVLPSTSEANAFAQQEIPTNPTEDASPEEQSAVSQDENNPANALRDSFKPYLQKQDLKAWIHSNSEPRSNTYKDWVFKAATPSNPLTELRNGSVSRESACAQDAVSAFFRQLQGYVA